MDNYKYEEAEIPLTDSEKYDIAFTMYTNANSPEKYAEAAHLLHDILNFRDADDLFQKCIKKGNLWHFEHVYFSAVQLMEQNNIYFLQKAATLFKSIPHWRDADEKLAYCVDEVVRQTALIAEKNETVGKRNKTNRTRKTILIVASFIIATLLYTLLLLLGNN